MRTIFKILAATLLLDACTAGNANNRPSMDEDVLTSVKKSEVSKKLEKNNSISYNLYLDNSYSMNGYFNGSTPFLNTLNRLITNLSNFTDDDKSSCKLFYVNNGINYCGNTTNGSIDKYLGNINNFFSNEQKGDRKVTDLKDVLKLVIDSISPNTVNIIVTDGIASPGLKGQESKTYLDILRNSIFKSVYSKLAQVDFSTRIIKCESDFTGTYINQLNQGVKLAGRKRPYYIFIFGSEAGANKVASILNSTSENTNYRSSLCFNNLHATPIKSKILLSSGYEIVGNASSMKIHKTEDINSDTKIRLLLDLSKMPENDDYYTNPDNYVIYPSGSQISISKIVNQEDMVNKGFTHKIILSTPNFSQTETINIKLKYQLPQWVKESNTEQDLELTEEEMEKKTFGLLYIVNGVMDGYQERKMLDNYFSLNILIQ